jgi:hypothetical protein
MANPVSVYARWPVADAYDNQLDQLYVSDGPKQRQLFSRAFVRNVCGNPFAKNKGRDFSRPSSENL